MESLAVPLVIALLVVSSTAAQAQQPANLPRVGFLSASNAGSMTNNVDAFRQGLRELGYVEGRNIIVEYRWAEGKIERLPELAAELERLRVDAIVSAGPSATHGAKRAAPKTQIVMAFDADPVGSGFVASLARPGGNITGLSILAPEVSGKQLEILTRIIPKLSRVLVLGDSKEPANKTSLAETERAAAALGVQVKYADRRTFKDAQDILRAARKENADALIVLVTSTSTAEIAQFAALAAKNRLPAMYPWASMVDAGGLITYSVRREDLYRRAATYVDKILKGSKAAELPVELPYKFELVINLKAAKEIGLTIPVDLLARADRVIQ